MKKIALVIAVFLAAALCFVLAACNGGGNGGSGTGVKTYIDGTFAMTSFQTDSAFAGKNGSINFKDATKGDYNIQFSKNGNITFICVMPVKTTSNGATTYEVQKNIIKGTYYFKNDKMTLKQGNKTLQNYEITLNSDQSEITLNFVLLKTTYYTAKYSQLD